MDPFSEFPPLLILIDEFTNKRLVSSTDETLAGIVSNRYSLQSVLTLSRICTSIVIIDEFKLFGNSRRLMFSYIYYYFVITHKIVNLSNMKYLSLIFKEFLFRNTLGKKGLFTGLLINAFNSKDHLQTQQNKKQLFSMDSTHLFKTAKTLADTRVSPSFALDQSNLSALNNTRSRVLIQPVPLQQSVQYGRVQQYLIPNEAGRPIARIAPQRVNDTIFVYCPVCKRQYSNSQAEYHASLHNNMSIYDFRMPRNPVPEKDNSSASTGSQISNRAVQYPLIEPLEFGVNQLNSSPKQDMFILKKRSNYDNVDRKLFEPSSAQLRDASVQFTKPPLQYESNNTDLYNFLDNAVNSKNGPKFSMADIFGNNQIVTPKRHLEDWETTMKTVPAHLRGGVY